MAELKIRSLVPVPSGHQFVFYGDSCSGVPDGPHEASHARMNAVVARLTPPPDFIVFPGDEVIGLVPDEASLKEQWRHWLNVEMAWLDRLRTPIFHSTGNHTTYNRMSERVFTEALNHLPRNGPPDQKGLAYFVRKDDLLLVFVHTLWSGVGGEGHVETDWLQQTLRRHADARWKFVVGHHPAYPVNGYEGPYQRTIGDEYVAPFWHILRENGVLAYLCSHILAFDVQCHEGVLQITSAGAGTAHRMPEDIEYLHAVQMAVDDKGLRYQVLDDEGMVRERLAWPPPDLPLGISLRPGLQPLPWAHGRAPDLVQLRLKGTARVAESGERQTVFAARDMQTGAMPLWIDLIGKTMQLTVILQPTAGRSPHYWFGSSLQDQQPFDIKLMLHGGMGPGGILWCSLVSPAWSSFRGISAWGMERLEWPDGCIVGAMDACDDTSFKGADLQVFLSPTLLE